MFALSLAASVALSPVQGSSAATRCGSGGGIYDVRVPGAPMGAVPMPDEQTVFVSINSANPQQPNGIAVLRCVSGRYQFDRLVSVENQPTISSLTPDAATLVVPDDNYIAFLDVQRILSGLPQAITGYIEDIPNDDGGAVYSAVSPDGRFAFVSEEQSGKLTVVDLQKIAGGAETHDAIVSEFLIGNEPVALAFSKDGAHLFATVQIALRKSNYPHTCKPEGDGAGDMDSPGAVVTIDVAKAERDPANAIVSSVPAACHPVRASLSPDGATLWVSARGSNSVLAFSTSKLLAGDATAQIASIAVGTAPVPIVATPDGRYVLAGNSNRFGAPGKNQELTVIDARTHTVAGSIPVGAFPRQFNVTPSGSAILLSNFGSGTITVIDPAAIPSLIKPASSH
jgi:DNA-binding beta-propeller fold protein YncE